MLTQLIATTLSAITLLQAKIDINVNIKDGDVLRGEQTFRVTVDSKNPVTQVEFYVGSDLRETDTSTPYEFRFDTLSEKEGEFTISFAAYTTEGESAKKVIKFKIDNDLAKGADYHTDKGVELLSNSKWDDAILEGRIALKAKPGFNPARILMARANLGKGVLDLAQKFAEDARDSEPSNLQALELLAVINLQKTFGTVNRGGDRNETLSMIGAGLKAAVESRKKSLDTQVDKFGAITDSNRLAYVDLLITSGRYSLVVNTLKPIFGKDTQNTAVSNRLIYAQIRASRWQDALQNMEAYRKFGKVDAYGYALASLIYSHFGDDQKSQDAEKEALQQDGDNLGVRTAQTYLALKRGSAASFAKLAENLAKDEGQRLEVNYYLTALYNNMGEYEDARRRFEKAVLTEPASFDMFIERGNEAVRLALTLDPNTENFAKEKEYQIKTARMLFETALVAKPESFEALTAMSMLGLIEGKNDEAIKYGTMATEAGSDYAAGYYSLSSAYAAANRTNEAEKNRNKAIKLDKANLEGRPIPQLADVFTYFYRQGRAPVIAPPR